MALQIEGQTSIFDFIPYEPVAPTKELTVGDKVKIHYYDDELAYVRECLPQFLGVAEIIEVCGDFCRVLLAGSVTSVDTAKLILI